jgi:hypothetical protein
MNSDMATKIANTTSTEQPNRPKPNRGLKFAATFSLDTLAPRFQRR